MDASCEMPATNELTFLPETLFAVIHNKAVQTTWACQLVLPFPSGTPGLFLKSQSLTPAFCANSSSVLKEH
jgi:hypothetical protein